MLKRNRVTEAGWKRYVTLPRQDRQCRLLINRATLPIATFSQWRLKMSSVIAEITASRMVGICPNKQEGSTSVPGRCQAPLF